MRSVPEMRAEYYAREMNYISDTVKNTSISLCLTCKNGWRFRHEGLNCFYRNTREFVQHLLHDRLHLKYGDTMLCEKKKVTCLKKREN